MKKYRNDLQDAVEYHEYVKQVEKDKNRAMDSAHRRYIAGEKAKQDQEQDKYYKFYKDFDARMNDRLKDYDRYKVPEMQKAAEAQRKLEEDYQRKLADEDAKRAEEERAKIHQQIGANHENDLLKR